MRPLAQTLSYRGGVAPYMLLVEGAVRACQMACRASAAGNASTAA